MPKLPWWLSWIVGWLKPDVDGLLANLAANRDRNVADIEAYAQKEGGYAQATATVLLQGLPSGGVWGFIKPELTSALSAGLTGLEGTVGTDAGAWYDQGLALLTKDVESVGL